MNKCLIIALDVSGSMSSDASLKDGDNASNITSVQLEAHAAQTLVKSLKQESPDSYLGVLTFDSSIKILQNPTNKYDADALCNIISKITDNSSTNMGQALITSLDMASPLLQQNFYVDIYLFTDGEPTVGLKEKEIITMLKEKMPAKKCRIHTFGFGPDIKSQFLYSVAEIGNGIFKYVSDPSMVGTCLINSACQFILNERNDKVEVPVLKDMFIPLNDMKYLDENSMLKTRELISLISKDHPLFKDKDQIIIACSNLNYFRNWGAHYLRTLLSSHEHQHCGNFKDSGLQGYANDEFQKMQDKIEIIFKGIKPPKNNIKMDNYVNPSGGCIRAYDLVVMADETMKMAYEVKRGDHIKSTNNKVGIIEWVLMCNDVKDLISMNNNKLHITPWHPIKVGGEWTFPALLTSAKNQLMNTDDLVVTFALKDKDTHSFFIQDIECLTLGHGIENDDVASHPFYGTEKVIEYIKSLAENQGNTSDGVVVDNVKDRDLIIKNS